jgi:hypothetical protein
MGIECNGRNGLRIKSGWKRTHDRAKAETAGNSGAYKTIIGDEEKP